MKSLNKRNKLNTQTHFPIPDSNVKIFSSGFVDRLVRPMHKHSDPKDLFKTGRSNACGPISIIIAFFGT